MKWEVKKPKPQTAIQHQPYFVIILLAPYGGGRQVPYLPVGQRINASPGLFQVLQVAEDTADFLVLSETSGDCHLALSPLLIMVYIFLPPCNIKHFHFLEKFILHRALRIHRFLCFADLETKTYKAEGPPPKCHIR